MATFRPYTLRYSLIFVLLLFKSGDGSENVENELILRTIPNTEQRISILVGNAKAEGDADADAGAGADPIESEGPSLSENVNEDACASGRCCFQYTWPGYIEDRELPAPSNATCDYLKKDRKDNTMACFDPIVFTKRVETSGDNRNPPDLEALKKMAREDNLNIYCTLTSGKSCLTYRFYERSGKKRMLNETLFCGSVTETTSGGAPITSGCYTQKQHGATVEVCTCTGSLCNGSTKPTVLFPLISFLVVILMFINTKM